MKEIIKITLLSLLSVIFFVASTILFALIWMETIAGWYYGLLCGLMLVSALELVRKAQRLTK